MSRRPETAAIKRQRSKDTKRYEEQLASEVVGGKRILASGSRPLSRAEMIASQSGAFGSTKSTTPGGDVISERYLIDQKRTEAGSVSIKRDVLRELSQGASRQHKIPMLAVTFTLPTTDPNRHNPMTQEHWVLVPKPYFDKLDALLDDSPSED